MCTTAACLPVCLARLAYALFHNKLRCRCLQATPWLEGLGGRSGPTLVREAFDCLACHLML